MLLYLVSIVLSNHQLFWNFQKCWKIQKSYKIFQNLENSKNFEKFKNFGKCKKVYDKITKPILKNSKKVFDITMAELKCNCWRRDTLTNITSNVVAFCHLSSHQSSTFFEIFKNLEKFKNCEKIWKIEKSEKLFSFKYLK